MMNESQRGVMLILSANQKRGDWAVGQSEAGAGARYKWRDVE